MRIWAAALIAALSNATCASAQTAQSEEIFQKYPGCTAHGTGQLQGDYTVEQRIAQCTAGINAHAYDGVDLAAFYFNRALLLQSLGRVEEVKPDLRAAYAVWPPIISNITMAIKDAIDRRQYDAAEEQLDWLSKVLPPDVMLPYYRAKIAFARNRLDEAAKYADAVLKAESDDPRILQFQADIKFARGDIDGALAIFDGLVTRFPGEGAYYNSRCYLRALAGRDLVEKALLDCNKALECLPKSSNVLDSRGFVYLRLGRYEEAIADYNAAVALSGNPLPTSLYGRGLAEQKSGQKLSGEADIDEAESIQPGIGKIFGTPAMMLE